MSCLKPLHILDVLTEVPWSLTKGPVCFPGFVLQTTSSFEKQSFLLHIQEKMRKRQILKKYLKSYFYSEFKRCLQVIFHFLKPWETIHVAANRENTSIRWAYRCHLQVGLIIFELFPFFLFFFYKNSFVYNISWVWFLLPQLLLDFYHPPQSKSTPLKFLLRKQWSI